MDEKLKYDFRKNFYPAVLKQASRRGKSRIFNSSWGISFHTNQRMMIEQKKIQKDLKQQYRTRFFSFFSAYVRV